MREIKIRMQEEEADAVKRKAKEAGMSQSAYIRKLIESGDFDGFEREFAKGKTLIEAWRSTLASEKK